MAKDWNCDISVSNLETLDDVKGNFSIQVPKTWKTNFYYDEQQSAIISADTTKNLTETVMIDATHVIGKLSFNPEFIQRFKSNLSQQKLVESTSYEFEFLNTPSYYSRALNATGKYPLEVVNIFLNTSKEDYLHATIKVYGDSLVNERLCLGLSLLENLQFNK